MIMCVVTGKEKMACVVTEHTFACDVPSNWMLFIKDASSRQVIQTRRQMRIVKPLGLECKAHTSASWIRNAFNSHNIAIIQFYHEHCYGITLAPLRIRHLFYTAMAALMHLFSGRLILLFFQHNFLFLRSFIACAHAFVHCVFSVFSIHEMKHWQNTLLKSLPAYYTRL